MRRVVQLGQTGSVDTGMTCSRPDPRISCENPGWGAPRIHGEMLKPGINIGETSVSKYLVHSRKPPSQTWRTFPENHLQSLVSVDFFVVSTIRFQILSVFLVLAHERRRIVHFAVTAHPTAEWTAQQMPEAFPWETPPQYLLRDRDRLFGKEFVDQLKAMGIKPVLSAPRSPWQRAHVERVIGTIRRECLDHLIIFDQRSLPRHLRGVLSYYHRSRTHWALAKDSPEHRSIQPLASGRISAIPEVGGLHHRYEQRGLNNSPFGFRTAMHYFSKPVVSSLSQTSAVDRKPSCSASPNIVSPGTSAPKRGFHLNRC
jgi:putative transposase